MGGEEKRKVTCIVCPLGCEATVTSRNGRVIKVENLECPRGEDYVLKEIEAPKRDFFTTVRVRGARVPVCPIRATQPVPKEKLLDCSKELAKVVVDAPVKIGDVIVENLLGLGMDIIVTRNLERMEKNEN